MKTPLLIRCPAVAFIACLIVVVLVLQSILVAYASSKTSHKQVQPCTNTVTDTPTSTIPPPLHDTIDVGSRENSTTTLEQDNKTIVFGNALTSNISTSSSSNRPKLILHVGPPKTGSTTIQCTLGHKNAQKLLNQDNYYYIGSFIEFCSYGGMRKFANQTLLRPFYYHDLHMCLSSKHDKSLKTSCKNRVNGRFAGKFKEFQATFDYHRQLGHNLIYSSEFLSIMPLTKDQGILPQLQELFDGFDVEVVFTYRDYFAYLVSLYQQVFRNKYTKVRSKSYPNESKSNGHIPPLARELDAFLTNSTLSEGPDARNTLFLEMVWENLLYMEKNQKEFFNVKYFRMEQGNNQELITNFVCQMIPGAENACSFFKDEDERKKAIGKMGGVQNAAADNELEADMLATALFEKGWINPGESSCNRFKMQQKLRPFLSEMKVAGSYPQQCATKLDELLQISIERLDQVMKYFVENDGKSMKDAMMKKWSDYIKAKKFCTLDIDSFIMEMESELKKRIEEFSCTAPEK